MPHGSIHTFKNVGDQPLRMLIMTVPSGFEKFFCRCHDEFAKPGGPDMSRVDQISKEHGIHFLQGQQDSEAIESGSHGCGLSR